MQWFRFYNDVINNPKVQCLPDDTFKAWVNILCLASQNDGKIPNLDYLSFALRMPLHAVTGHIDVLFAAGLIDEKNGQRTPHNWAKRQFKSDTSKDRVKRYRDRYKKQDRNVTVTPPEQIQNRADTEQKKKERLSAYSPIFEEAWKAYPTTPAMSKREGWKAWQKGSAPEADMLKAVKAYADSLKKPNAPFAAHFATFFNQHRYEGFTLTASVFDDPALTEMQSNLSGVQAELCEGLTPEIYQAWLSKAQVMDAGNQVKIYFPTAFQMDYFRTHYAGKAEQIVGKNVNCYMETTNTGS